MTLPDDAQVSVNLQKKGLTSHQIATYLNVTSVQVSAWWRMLNYDPVAFHAAEIILSLSSGDSISHALASVGLHPSTERFALVKELAEKNGVEIAARAHKNPEEGLRCEMCGILLEEYDPDDKDQPGWENWSNDGVVCVACERREKSGFFRMPALQEGWE